MGGSTGTLAQLEEDGVDPGRLWDLLEDAFLRHPDGRRSIPIFAAIPDSLLPAMLDCWWDEARLFQLVSELQVEDTWTYQLEWALDVRLWPSEAGPFTVTPREVMTSPQLHPEHWRTTLGVELGHPVVLAQKGSHWVVLDGYHRILKATVQRTPSIRIVRLHGAMLRSIMIESGFYGELNRLRRLTPDLFVPARSVARTLLQRPGAEWAQAAASHT
jgi:hypothetical protein